jgi:hypothetical protein
MFRTSISHSIILNVISTAVTNSENSPIKNKKSANFSYLMPSAVVLRIDRKDRIQLNINENMANAVNSSITDAAFI